MTQIVFFGGKFVGPSEEYEIALLKAIMTAKNIMSAQIKCYYTNTRAESSWFEYVPTWAEIVAIATNDRDTFTSNVNDAVINNLVVEHSCSIGANIYIGASQGGVLACEMAIQTAKRGQHVHLILLSSSPTPRQLEELQELKYLNLVTAYATVGWYECYFGGILAFRQRDSDWYATPKVLANRLRLFATVLMFDGSHCKENHINFKQLADWIVSN